MERIVLAYSGGLDTSVAIPWLRDAYRAEVITVTVDLGQGPDLEAVRDRALAAGAVRAHVLDLREDLARDFMLPALKADAVCEDRRPLGTALGRPLIAHALMKIAGIERAAVVAHGGAVRGHNRARLDVALQALDPTLRVLAPGRDWTMTRPEAVAYAGQQHIPLPPTVSSPFSADGNLWGRSVTGGVLDDPWTEPPEEIYALTKPPAERPPEPAYVEIAFERGAPAAINGVAMPLLDILSSLTTIAGAHGVGRLDRIEDGPAGVKTRTVYEAPAAVVLHTAHKELQALVTTKELGHFSRAVSLQYADVVRNGLWYSPLREALDAFVDRVQKRVTGVVRLKLFKGDCHVVGRRSPHALCDHAAPTPPVVVGA